MQKAVSTFDASAQKYQAESPNLAKEAQRFSDQYDALNVHDDQFDAARNETDIRFGFERNGRVIRVDLHLHGVRRLYGLACGVGELERHRQACRARRLAANCEPVEEAARHLVADTVKALGDFGAQARRDIEQRSPEIALSVGDAPRGNPGSGAFAQLLLEVAEAARLDPGSLHGRPPSRK